jgi:hypothetical protein
MKKLISSLLVCCLSFAVIATPASLAQDPPAQEQNATKAQPVANALTNKDVIDLLKAGLTAEVIVAKIKSSATNFDTSPAALSELKAANVPDDVILAMVGGQATSTFLMAPKSRSNSRTMHRAKSSRSVTSSISPC